MRYWREIVAILMVKAVVLFAIHETYFDQPVPRQERVEHLGTHVYGVVPPQGDRRK